MSVLTEVIDEKKYAGLLSKALPQVIRTEEDNERYIALLESLDDRKHPSAEEKRLAAIEAEKNKEAIEAARKKAEEEARIAAQKAAEEARAKKAALEAEQKAKRDAKYAARKERGKKKR